MNVKIKETGVYCPFGEDYEQTYAALKRQLVNEDEQLFTERATGHGFLQWDLPGAGWRPLSEADPLLEQEIRAEYQRRQQLILSKFGNNQAMAMRIMQVPDDSYVYYKIEESKKIQIKLTAWGYSYPERIDQDDATGVLNIPEEKEQVTLRFVYAGEPIPNKAFILNKVLARVSEPDGTYYIGELPVDYQFDIEVDNKEMHMTVAKGNGNICIDLTEYVTIEVSAYKDNLPYDGAKTTVAYMGQRVEMTFCNGIATARLPLSLDGEMCTVTADDETQQRPLAGGIEKFTFHFVSPAVPEPSVVPESFIIPEPEKVPEPDIVPEPDEVRKPDIVLEPEEEPEPEKVPEPDIVPETDNKSSIWDLLLTGLLALLIAVLLYFTFCFGLGMLL